MLRGVKVSLLYIALIAGSCQLATSAPKASTKGLPSNCEEAYKKDGVYTIYVADSGLEPFPVYCMKHPKEVVPWTVILRRVNASTDFYRDLLDYKYGFGDVNANFWIGLEQLHALTTLQGPQELWVELLDNASAYAKYDRFAIGSEYEQYALKELGTYTGTAGDSLRESFGMKFTTRDVDYDLQRSDNCAVTNQGAWWYKQCHLSNLNGVYGSADYGTGINWSTFRGYNVSMKYAHMAIRPVRV